MPSSGNKTSTVSDVEGSYLVVVRELQRKPKIFVHSSRATVASDFIPGTVMTNADADPSNENISDEQILFSSSADVILSSQPVVSTHPLFRKELIKGQVAAHLPSSIPGAEVIEIKRDLIKRILQLENEVNYLNSQLDSSINRVNLEGIELIIESLQRRLRATNLTMKILFKEVEEQNESIDNVCRTKEIENSRSFIVLKKIHLISVACEEKIEKLSAFNNFSKQKEDKALEEKFVPPTPCCAVM